MGERYAVTTLPAPVQIAVDDAIGAVRATPGHRSHQRDRRTIYDAFGPRGDARRYRARVWLALLAAERILPLYEAAVPQEFERRRLHPRRILSVVRDVATGVRANDKGLGVYVHVVMSLTSHRPYLAAVVRKCKDVHTPLLDEVRGLVAQEEEWLAQRPAEVQEQVEWVIRLLKVRMAIRLLSQPIDCCAQAAYQALAEAWRDEGIRETGSRAPEDFYLFQGELRSRREAVYEYVAGRTYAMLPDGTVLSTRGGGFDPYVRTRALLEDEQLATLDYGDAAASAAVASSWDRTTGHCDPKELLAFWEWWHGEAVPAAWHAAQTG